ncbi:syndecan-3-like isoform X2 [Narcine bancroftii]|uniref:syndecan-3-like isoform X2 n=1 Tax=Narcine bancroftii TaxID=1343680 RepID=UPI00383232D4
MTKISALLPFLLIPSLCDIVSMYRTSRQTQDLATLTDLEGSGSDDEDEGLYSGSGGSGYFELDTDLRFTTGMTRAVTATPSTSAFGSIQPFTFTFRSTTLAGGSSSQAHVPTSAALTTQLPVTAAPAPATVPADTGTTTTLRATTASTGAATTSTVIVPVTHSNTAAIVPPAVTGITAMTKQSVTSPGAVARPLFTSDPQTDQSTSGRITSGSSKDPLSVPSLTEKTSSIGPVEDMTINNEVEARAAGSPSGDFELTEEGEVVNPGANNEVFAVVTQPTVQGTGKIGLPDIIDNAIDSGSSSSAAQLPQKNILERKEVLVAVVVGGVVGALFAAFLVMLLIYRMKKKDEGSYTLEEPKQASIAYQKPDKQEEFYA